MTTSRILTNLFNKRSLNENLSLAKEDIMQLELPSISYIQRHINDEPIKVITSKWETFNYGDYIALNRTYEFKSKDHLQYFLIETLNESHRLDHELKIIVTGMKVEIITYTHDINDVTDVDVKLSKLIDEIYQDIFFIA